MRAILSIETGDGSPRVFQLATDRPASLGRSRDNAIVLRDEHASRRHAEVRFQGGCWWIRDTDTLNGTKLNGKLIAKEAKLCASDVIHIGNTSLRFELAEGLPADDPTQEITRPTKEYPVLPGPSPAEIDTTRLQPDDLTALCSFMAAAVGESDPRALIRRALQVLMKQTGASVSGFLSLDSEAPLPKVVQPDMSRVDIHLSRQLTQRVLRDSQPVWLGQDGVHSEPNESICSFADAMCLPLLAGSQPLGALHAYKANTFFKERDLRFAEVVAGYLSNSLLVLRARHNLEMENSRLRMRSTAADQLVGTSAAMEQLRQTIARVAPRTTTILIEGESGVGKELVAQALHRQSTRSSGPLVVVNCAAIAPNLLESELFGYCKGAFTGAEKDHPGLFQQADDGTLFLDEVGELSQDCQAKLLRVLEGKGFRPIGSKAEVQTDVRIIAATHRDLGEEVREGRFRQDLYFRLRVIQIVVPPLRERVEDIAALLDYYLEKLSRECRRSGVVQLTEDAKQALEAYAWPGNVRELRAVLERAIVMSDHDELDAMDLGLPAGAPVRGVLPTLCLDDLETLAIREALRQTRGNKTAAAKILGIARDTLATRIKQKKLSDEDAAR